MRRLAKLDRKLLRDLLRMKMQMAAVSAVLACGVVLSVMANGMYDSLRARARSLLRPVPHGGHGRGGGARALSLVPQLEAVPGVRALETRVAGVGLLDMPGRSDPVSARLVSLPPDRAAARQQTWCCARAACRIRPATARCWSTRPLPKRMASRRAPRWAH